MAFIGIFMLAWLVIVFLIIVGCLILFVYIPAIVMTIIGIIKGVKNKWPRGSIIMTSVAGSIVAVFTIIILFFVVWIAVHPNVVTPMTDSGSSSLEALLPYLIY